MGTEVETDVDLLAPVIEAILMSMDRPVSAAKLAEAMPAPHTGGDDDQRGEAARVRDAIQWLNASYEQSGRSFRIESVAGGYRLMTLPAHADAVASFHKARERTRLSKAAMETLAIVAYRQPITRAQLEAIRGVGCGEILRALLDRRLLTITGRAEELGRPMLYGTSKRFLEVFGLASLKDLPSVRELRPTES